MNTRLQIRLGGYSHRGSTHSRGLDKISESLVSALGDAIEVSIDYNILDQGRQVQDLLAGVEAGRITACYFSTSYLTGKVPEIGVLDIPFLFDSLEDAHASVDGDLGDMLTAATARSTGLVALGYWDNGFRHLSTRHRAVYTPADCKGLHLRLQPNWAHEQYFRSLGAEPVLTDLKDGIDRLRSGELDAQENPLANFMAYGIHHVHRYVTLTGHAYGARGIYASAKQLETWPENVLAALRAAVAGAVAQQRAEAAAEERDLEEELGRAGTSIIRLSDDQRDAFKAKARPVRQRAAMELGADLVGLAGTQQCR